jgi:hypothetical protein
MTSRDPIGPRQGCCALRLLRKLSTWRHKTRGLRIWIKIARSCEHVLIGSKRNSTPCARLKGRRRTQREAKKDQDGGPKWARCGGLRTPGTGTYFRRTRTRTASNGVPAAICGVLQSPGIHGSSPVGMAQWVCRSASGLSAVPQ